jgi:hypothetical protein
MRTITAALALALCLLGCSIFQQPVKLLTYDAFEAVAMWACCELHIQGTLLPDPDVGTVLRSEQDGRLHTIIWPAGYTGLLVGSEVEVLNEKGDLVARTGGTYNCRQLMTPPDVWYGCRPVADSP